MAHVLGGGRGVDYWQPRQWRCVVGTYDPGTRGAYSLPVVTIGDPQRVIRDPAYARECAISLLDALDRIEMLRGTGRLFTP
jgi:hypothetical protein